MNYWIFKANPEQYRIDDRLQNPYPFITWPVTRYQDRIKKDDTVFIWRPGTPRGICGVMTVEESPFEPAAADLSDGFELPPGSTPAGVEHWAKCRIIQRFPVIDMAIIKKIPGLELFSFFSAFQQAINFSITRPEASILLEFIEKYLQEEHDKPRETEKRPVTRPTRPAPRPLAAKVSPQRTGEKRTAPASTNVTLLKCDVCGRFVVSSDTERHVRDVHDGFPVEWKKVK